MKRILFVVRGFYPEISASGNLIKPLVNELGKNNFVCVLSNASHNYESELSKNIILKKNKINESNNKLSKRFNRIIKKYFFIKDHNKTIVTSMEEQIEKLDQKYEFDLIIAVTYEEMLALVSSNINKNKKYIFILEKLPIKITLVNPFIYLFKLYYKKTIEKKIINSVNKVFALPTMYKYYSKKIIKENKLIKLNHPMITDKVSYFFNPNSKMKFIYGGGLDRKQRNPTKIIKFFKKLNEDIELELTFYSYGNMQKKLSMFSKKYEFINSHGTITSDKLDEKIEKSDFIVTIGNKDSSIVPSKIFDCISTGKPIIHFSQLDNDPYKNYLKQYNNSIIINYNEIFNKKALKRVESFLKNKKNNIVEYNEIKQNYNKFTPEFVAKRLLEKADK